MMVTLSFFEFFFNLRIIRSSVGRRQVAIPVTAR